MQNEVLALRADKERLASGAARNVQVGSKQMRTDFIAFESKFLIKATLNLSCKW